MDYFDPVAESVSGLIFVILYQPIGILGTDCPNTGFSRSITEFYDQL